MPINPDLGEVIRSSRSVKISFDTPQGTLVMDMPRVMLNGVNISQSIKNYYSVRSPMITETEFALSVKPVTYNFELLPNGTEVDCEDSDELNEFLSEFSQQS